MHGSLDRRRADIVGFVNGLPLLFVECKNIHRDLEAAFEQDYSDYRDTVPHLFHHNAVVMFGNGEKAKIGSITSRWEHFHAWKRLAEEEPGAVDMETLLKGVCHKRNFMDLNVAQRLEQELRRDYHVVTAGRRLDQVARDFVRHYSAAWETGKAMLVCVDKVTCVRMHALIDRYWNERIQALAAERERTPDEQEAIYLFRNWTRRKTERSVKAWTRNPWPYTTS